MFVIVSSSILNFQSKTLVGSKLDGRFVGPTSTKVDDTGGPMPVTLSSRKEYKEELLFVFSSSKASEIISHARSNCSNDSSLLLLDDEDDVLANNECAEVVGAAAIEWNDDGVDDVVRQLSKTNYDDHGLSASL